MKIFAEYALNGGGSIHPLIISSELTDGLGLMNPSIFIRNNKILVNLRAVNYTFYHSEAKLFQHQWGPLTYVHPENDQHLRTDNYYLELNDDFEITRCDKIDTSTFDTYEPKWDFVGLEDARIFEWENKLYISGVRRDTTTNGEGRMELSEIIVTDESVKEVSRFRIPPPNDPNSYCEKNWMPILDLPYHYVKWGNPTEVVKVNPDTKTCATVFTSDRISLPRDLRGGSQIISWKDYYLTFTHEVDLFQSETDRKDARYYHRIILWDKNWNIVKYSNEFSLMDGHVEFCVGLTKYKEDFLITFGFQDNAAYLLKFSEKVLEDFLNENDDTKIQDNQVFSINQNHKSTSWVVDDFYDNPDEVRKFALEQEFGDESVITGFVGRRTFQQFLFSDIKEKFESIMSKTITKWEEYGMNGRFQICWSGERLVYHCDSQKWAGMIYLTPNAPYQCGTTLYAHKQTRARTYYDDGWDAAWKEVPGDPHLDRTPFEPVDVIGNVYNRLVIFDASCIHSASEYFGSFKENARLWQMFFFDAEDLK